MNKKELIQKVKERCMGTDISKSQIELVLNELTSSIIEGVSEEGVVKISGLGNFSAKFRQPRIARNPKTGEKINVPSKVVPSFTPSKKFKEFLLENNA